MTKTCEFTVKKKFFSTCQAVFDGIPAVGGLKFSIAQKLQKLTVGGNASWGTSATWRSKFNPWTNNFFPIL